MYVCGMAMTQDQGDESVNGSGKAVTKRCKLAFVYSVVVMFEWNYRAVSEPCIR
jgi:hypothetical protein